MKLLLQKKGYDVYVQFDASAGVYEIFSDADGVGYIGCSDGIGAAKAVANDWIEEQIGG